MTSAKKPALSKPELIEAPESAAEVVTPSFEMGTDIANAIVTRAPLTLAQLHCALGHYAELEAVLRRSGPRFTNCRRDAADMYNQTLELLREAEAKSAEDTVPRRQPLQA